MTGIEEDIEESSDIGRGHSDITPAITQCYSLICISLIHEIRLVQIERTKGLPRSDSCHTIRFTNIPSTIYYPHQGVPHQEPLYPTIDSYEFLEQQERIHLHQEEMSWIWYSMELKWIEVQWKKTEETEEEEEYSATNQHNEKRIENSQCIKAFLQGEGDVKIKQISRSR